MMDMEEAEQIAGERAAFSPWLEITTLCAILREKPNRKGTGAFWTFGTYRPARFGARAAARRGNAMAQRMGTPLGLTEAQVALLMTVARGIDPDQRSVLLERVSAQFRIVGRLGHVQDSELEAALTSALVSLQQDGVTAR